MTDLRKAAEMALEALNEVTGWQWSGPMRVMDEVEDAIQALRQALAQPEQEPLGEEWVPCVKLPVVVHVRNQRDGETHISTREGITPVLPDDLIMRGVAGEEYPIGRELFERTYTFDTAPPKREWVGLTDDEITMRWSWSESREAEETATTQQHAFAYAIEAKLKEKNT